MQYELLFKSVTVIDGSGSKGVIADVATAGDEIVAIGPDLTSPAAMTFTGHVKVLAPGFIDVHTHDDTNVIRFPEMLPKISQGVTSVIVGNCGISAVTATITDAVPDPMNLLGSKQDFTYPTVSRHG